MSNIQTAFHTRPSTWKLDRSQIIPSTPVNPTITTITTNTTSQILSTLHDDTSNDSNNTNEALVNTESELSLQAMEDSSVNNNDNQLVFPRYEGRSERIQAFLHALLTSNAKTKSTSGNPTNLAANNPATATSAITSQSHETDKLLSLLEHLCGLPDIRLYILSRLDIWLQNHKLKTAEKLMITLCENLTKPPVNTSANTLTNGHSKVNDTSYVDERAIEQLVNIRFKPRASFGTTKMYISCIREMLKTDANLVDIVVRFIVYNELQHIPSSSASTTITSKNPNNLPLLHACCQSQPESTCQSLAYTIQSILLLTNVTTTSKDYDNLLKTIRIFLRELMRYAKNDFDSMRFCMYLVDMHYSSNVQEQFWTMVEQNEPSTNDITTNRLYKRLLECDMSTRERFFYTICDLISMVILSSAHAFHSMNNSTTNSSNSVNARSSTTTTTNATINHEQRLLFIHRIALIQCSVCLFFRFTLSRLFDGTSTINYMSCLYSIFFNAPINSYLRLETWPPDEPIGLRNDLFRLSYTVPLLGETLYLLIQIGLTPQFRINPAVAVELIDSMVRRTFNVEQNMTNDYVSIYLRLPENRCEIFLKKIFELTRYYIPIQIQLPSSYEIPKNLSITDMFWKTCLVCLLLASHDPQIFGRFIWTSIPQIRLFMEMLLTGDYTYPPKSMVESKNFLEKFYQKERIQLREEKDLILGLEKYLASPKIIDESNSQLLGKIISFDLQQIKRPTSQDKNEKQFYHLIQGLNNTFKLSSMLCRCRSPDFILDILNRQEQQQGKMIIDSQTSWLTSLIDSNIDCLHVFPIICLCDYFQHMIRIYHQKSNPSKKTVHALETILLRFRSILQTVKEQSLTNTAKSSSTDDLTCIFNYFFNCLNSNISNMRSNAWLCLYLILDDQARPAEAFLFKSEKDEFSEGNLALILRNISQLKSLEATQLLIKQTLARTCEFEKKISLLNYSIRFVLEHCRLESTEDQQLLAHLARALTRRHSILYRLIQYDKQTKHGQLIEQYFHLFMSMFIQKLQNTLQNPIEISSENSSESASSSVQQTYLILPNFHQEQIDLVKQFENEMMMKKEFAYSSHSMKQYIPLDAILLELLIIFLAYFDSDNSTLQRLNHFAQLLQQFLLNPHWSLSWSTIEQIDIPIPIKQNQDQIEKTSTNDETHFKQFAIEDNHSNENSRKRRLSPSQSSEKVFVTSSMKSLYRIVPVNNESEQSLFTSDDLQYFIFKSNHLPLVKRCIDQASLSTCLKMFQISVNSEENIRYLCQHLNQLLDNSEESISIVIKQSSFIRPLLNRWISKQLPKAIQLGEKLKKFIEEKKTTTTKKSVHTTEETLQQSNLIPTTSRSSTSISDQLLSFDQRINKRLLKSSIEPASNDDQHMEISEPIFTIPWSTLAECESLLRYLLKKSTDPIRRRQLLVQVQLLSHTSEQHRRQLMETIIQCCQVNDQEDFRMNLHQQSDVTLVLLNIFTKDSSLDEHLRKLFDLLTISHSTTKKSLLQSKIEQLNHRLIHPSNVKSLSTASLLEVLHQPRFEQSLAEYFHSNHLDTDQCQSILINVLVQNEDRLSEPTIGMILDQLERIDSRSSKSSNTSIYSNTLLFSQRTHSSISQRLLLKQFLHSCDWSTILHSITHLLTTSSNPPSTLPTIRIENSPRLIPSHPLKQSRLHSIHTYDSTLILDMLEAFIKLSPLWTGREYQMLDRCHEELLIDFQFEHIYTLILYILDEGDRYSTSRETLSQQYQKRYESILHYLMKSPDKKQLVQRSLQKIWMDLQSNLSWKNLLTSFYFIIYVNQSDLFLDHDTFIFSNLFSEAKQMNCLQTNYDPRIHDLLIRLNSDILSPVDNLDQINRLLKHYVSTHPLLFLRYLSMIKRNLQSRLTLFNHEEFNRRNSRQRTYFLSSFDLITRLKPFIYDSIYQDDLQTILEIYIRLITNNLNVFNTCTKQNLLSYTSLQDYIHLIDGFLHFIDDYFSSTINHHQHNGLIRMSMSKFLEKIQEKIQLNKDLQQYLLANKYNQISYHLKQLKILYDAMKFDEINGKTCDDVFLIERCLL